MNDDVIITSYVVTVDVMKAFGHESHVLAQVSDADVVFIAIMAALYFQNHHERALCVMQGMGYVTGRLSISRFNRRLHQLAHWLAGILAVLCDLFRTGETFVIDSMPVQCVNVSEPGAAGRCVEQTTVGIAPPRRRSSLAGVCI